MKRFFFPLLCLGLMFSGLSCSGKKQNMSLRLTPTERNRIDTLYTSRLDSLRPIWDSLCEDRYAEVVRLAVDSIVDQRLEEEQRLRARTAN
jgi:hypothetical protein